MYFMDPGIVRNRCDDEGDILSMKGHLMMAKHELVARYRQSADTYGFATIKKHQRFLKQRGAQKASPIAKARMGVICQRDAAIG